MMTAPRLLAYLVDKKHWSPYQMADLTIEITTTRDIARQILRHRSFEFQEFSQRYAEVVAEPVIREARMQDPKNRQSSLATEDTAVNQWWAETQEKLARQSASAYKAALSAGIAKEVARAVLPEGNTESVIYMKGSVRSWIHYIWTRTDMSTQKEHRDVALACQSILLEHFPDLSLAISSYK